MTTITIRSKDYSLDDLTDGQKLLAFDIGKITGEIDEAEYKLRTLSALREVLATKFEEEHSSPSTSSNGVQDTLTGI